MFCPQDSCTLSCLAQNHIVSKIFHRVCPKLLLRLESGYQSDAGRCELRTNRRAACLGSTVICRTAFISLSCLCDAQAWMWSSQPAGCLCVVFDGAVCVCRTALCGHSMWLLVWPLCAYVTPHTLQSRSLYLWSWKVDQNSELIFGATAATGGRVKFLNNCVNLSENNANCFTISPSKR